MPNIPGRFFKSGLGNLPDYSGNAPNSPVGAPPPIRFTPSQSGQTAAALAPNQAYWQSMPFLAGVTAVMLQPFLLRKFFLIQNKDPLLTIYVGFGWKPDASNGLILAPGVGYEPFSYPVNEIWVSASGVDAVGLMISGY